MPAQDSVAMNGTNGVSSCAPHCVEHNQHYSDTAGQDDIETFLFTSESVGEGHPGTDESYVCFFG